MRSSLPHHGASSRQLESGWRRDPGRVVVMFQARQRLLALPRWRRCDEVPSPVERRVQP
jgi:hypothetical protein